MPYKDYKKRKEQWTRAALVRKNKQADLIKGMIRAKTRQAFPKAEKCSINDCEKIGQRHHPDYSKPLDIIWLCSKHHGQAHSNKTERKCTVENCNKKFRAKGLCHSHWMKKNRPSRSKVVDLLKGGIDN